MAWLAVNKDGSEVIGKYLIRATYLEEDGDNVIVVTSKVNGDFWCDPLSNSEYGVMNASIILPKGSIKKLIGRELTWEDEPVELK